MNPLLGFLVIYTILVGWSPFWIRIQNDLFLIQEQVSDSCRSGSTKPARSSPQKMSSQKIGNFFTACFHSYISLQHPPPLPRFTPFPWDFCRSVLLSPGSFVALVSFQAGPPRTSPIRANASLFLNKGCGGRGLFRCPKRTDPARHTSFRAACVSDL
jgi:hypothetical protein